MSSRHAGFISGDTEEELTQKLLSLFLDEHLLALDQLGVNNPEAPSASGGFHSASGGFHSASGGFHSASGGYSSSQRGFNSASGRRGFDSDEGSISPSAHELIKKQKIKFPGILRELQQYGKKREHWAWWVWPTTLQGGSEPPPLTSIHHHEIPYLLENTDLKTWTDILEAVNYNVEATGREMVIPTDADRGRIKYFCTLFLDADSDTKDKYRSFFDQVDRLSKNFKD